MSARLTRLAPLVGVPAVVLIVASLVVTGDTPTAHAHVGSVVAFYHAHASQQTASGVLGSLGALLFVVFAATLASLLRGGTDRAARGPAALCLAGGVLVALGVAVFAGLSLAIGDTVDVVDGSTLQALNVLDQELFFPLTIGTGAFMLGAGAAVLRTALLPRWLGWVAVVVASVAAVPSHVLGGPLDHIGFVAVIGLGVWTLIASVMLTRWTPEGAVTTLA